jgi:predicted secreted protein
MAARGGRKRDNLARGARGVKQRRYHGTGYKGAEVKGVNGGGSLAGRSGYIAAGSFARAPSHPGSRTVMSRAILHLTLAAVCALAACGTAPRETDPAKAIHVRPGKSFRITLQSRGSMGQRWSRVDPAAAAPLTLVDSGSIPPRKVTLGGSGHRYWTFRASRPGETTVSMMSIFYGDTTRTDTTRFRVVIR